MDKSRDPENSGNTDICISGWGMQSHRPCCRGTVTLWSSVQALLLGIVKSKLLSWCLSQDPWEWRFFTEDRTFQLCSIPALAFSPSEASHGVIWSNHGLVMLAPEEICHKKWEFLHLAPAGNAHELQPQPALSSSGSVERLWRQRNSILFSFCIRSILRVVPSTWRNIKGSGCSQRNLFFFLSQSHSQAEMAQWAWGQPLFCTLSSILEVNLPLSSILEVNLPLSSILAGESPWAALAEALPCFTPIFHWHSHQQSIPVIYCSHNWMIINFVLHILILKQVLAFIPYKYHPHFLPKPAPGAHLGHGPSSGASTWWNNSFFDVLLTLWSHEHSGS